MGFHSEAACHTQPYPVHFMTRYQSFSGLFSRQRGQVTGTGVRQFKRSPVANKKVVEGTVFEKSRKIATAV
jgi:hypothetical protein